MSYYVYILASRAKTLYIGVTNNLERRVWEHKTGMLQGFTKKYNVNRLVYYETSEDIQAAIQREKQLKGWLRIKKLALVESINPEWDDISQTWYRADETLRFAQGDNVERSGGSVGRSG